MNLNPRPFSRIAGWCTRVNEMHGEQEAKLILDDEFHHDQQQSEHVEQTSRMDVEELRMH